MSVRASLFGIALFANGCGGTIGPLVTDVRWAPRGELVITRCMLDVSGSGSMTSYDLEDCSQTVLPPPYPAYGAPGTAPPPPGAATVPVPAPPNNSATVVH